MFSQDTLRPAKPPAQATITPGQRNSSERHRSSSMSESFAHRVFGIHTSSQSHLPDQGHAPGGQLSATSSFRRRSSGGGAQTATTPSGGGPALLNRQSVASVALGRRESQSTASFLRSPILSSSSATDPSSSMLMANVPTLKTLDSYNARNVAAALDQGTDQGRMVDDVWQTVCVKVLPLFNGEGIRGFVEDLNDLVLIHVQRTFVRASSSTNRTRYPSTRHPSLDLSSLVTGLLIADLTDLVRIGCSTLSTRLSPPPPPFPSPGSYSPAAPTASWNSLSDQKLVDRLNEIWLFFYTGILPQLEAVFWVLRCDDRLRAAVGGTGIERNEERGRGRGEGRIDVTRIALIEFRDRILHPEIHRVAAIFDKLAKPTAAEARQDDDPYNQAGRGGVQGGTDPASTSGPPPVSVQDIRRSRSQPPRPATATTTTTTAMRPSVTAASSAFLSPPVASSSTGVFSPPALDAHTTAAAAAKTTGDGRIVQGSYYPTATSTPPNHLPATPIRQFSSPARLPSPDPSPSNSPSSTRRNTMTRAPTEAGAATRRAQGGRECLTQTRQSSQRRLQMILVLKALRTRDDRQDEIESLARSIVPRKFPGSSSPSVRRHHRRSSRHRGHGDSLGTRRVGSRRPGSDGEDDFDDNDSEASNDEKGSGRSLTPAAAHGGGGEGVDNSPRILFDEPSDLIDGDGRGRGGGEGGELDSARLDRHQRRLSSGATSSSAPLTRPQNEPRRRRSSQQGAFGERRRREEEAEGEEDFIASPYSTTTSTVPSRSNSWRAGRRPAPPRGRGRDGGGGGGSTTASGYASPILSTSPPDNANALDLSRLGYALIRVREEGDARAGYATTAGGGGDASESSDGVTPTASGPASVLGGGGGFVAASTDEAKNQDTNHLKPTTNRRRSLFLPTRKLSRSNSTQSNVSSSTTALEHDLSGGGGAGGEGAGERGTTGLRRNLLLRRNSSRNSTTILQQQQQQHVMSTVLGGRGLEIEDE